jgi:hypothetical protein
VYFKMSKVKFFIVKFKVGATCHYCKDERIKQVTCIFGNHGENDLVFIEFKVGHTLHNVRKMFTSHCYVQSIRTTKPEEVVDKYPEWKPGNSGVCQHRHPDHDILMEKQARDQKDL